MRIRYLIAVLVLLILISLPSPAQAGGVVTICDETHLLAALTGGGTVTFACSGTITLTSTITIVANTTIDGSGQTVAISGNDTTLVFSVNQTGVLDLKNLTIINGSTANPGYPPKPAGGVFNARGVLNVSNSIFLDNKGTHTGGIYNLQGTVTITNSSFMGNTLTNRGRDINNYQGTVTVSNSTFANDPVGSTTSGGGISNFGGTLIVSNSTFFGNRAYYGGAISNENPNGTVAVSNSTFHGNKAFGYGGGINNLNGGEVAVINSTFSGNEAGLGGGVANIGTSLAFTLKNTLIANNPSGNNCGGAITDGGGNLSYPDASCPGINADPVLGPLQHNGGPTWTMALGTGSAAIDAGDDATCAASPVNNQDQRGVARPVGPRCDIGAFEAIYSTMPVRAWLPILMTQ